MDIYKYFDNLSIAWEEHKHKPVFTVDEAQTVDKEFPGAKTKNLFLRNKKKTKYFLVSTLANKQIDLKTLEKSLDTGRLSFGNSSDLMKFLKTDPGAVSPFALISNSAFDLGVVVDKELFDFDYVNFHPPRTHLKDTAISRCDRFSRTARRGEEAVLEPHCARAATRRDGKIAATRWDMANFRNPGASSLSEYVQHTSVVASWPCGNWLMSRAVVSLIWVLNNAATLTVSREGFRIFLESLPQKIVRLDLSEKTA